MSIDSELREIRAATHGPVRALPAFMMQDYCSPFNIRLSATSRWDGKKRSLLPLITIVKNYDWDDFLAEWWEWSQEKELWIMQENIANAPYGDEGAIA